MPPSSPSASPSSLTTSPHSPRSPTPSLSPSSFDTASSGGSEPAIPVYGRKTGVEGYIAEEGSGMRGDGSAASASGSSGEESEREVTPEEEELDKMERRKLSRRIEAEKARVSEELRISVELHGEAHMKPLAAQAVTSLAYPSINLGGAPHLPASQSLFAPIPLPKDGDLDIQRRADTVDEWRAALRDAHQVSVPTRPASEGSNSALATATTSTPKPVVTKPSLPVLVLPPPFPPTCKASSQQSTPVAHDFQPSFPPFSFPFSGSAASSPAASIVGDPFQLFHPDLTTDPGKLPLPDAPGAGDYVFPDGRGRASFSSESTIGGGGGGRSESRSRSRSPGTKEKATTLAPPALGHKASNPESLSDLYRRPEEDEGEQEKAEEEKRGRPCGMVAAASDAGDSDEDEEGKEVEQKQVVEAVDPAKHILLSLPPSLAHLSHCPRCHRPLSPIRSSSPSAYAADEHDGEKAKLQLWAEEHWNCVPWVAGGEGVRVVVGERSG
ncbi:hypothetical protein JCM8097_006267 [Rhodosporidiobolus ruineniae]